MEAATTIVTPRYFPYSRSLLGDMIDRLCKHVHEHHQWGNAPAPHLEAAIYDARRHMLCTIQFSLDREIMCVEVGDSLAQLGITNAADGLEPEDLIGLIIATKAQALIFTLNWPEHPVLELCEQIHAARPTIL